MTSAEFREAISLWAGYKNSRPLYELAIKAADKLAELEAKIEELEESVQEARWSAMGEDL